MAGFRKEIGTSVDVPNIQVPQSTGDDVSDALNIASFGLNIYGQVREQELARQRKQRQEQLLGEAQVIAEDLFDARSQKELTAVEETMRLNKRLSTFTNPVERQMVQELVAEQLTTGLYKEARKEMLDASEQLNEQLREIDKRSPELAALVFQGKNIDQMSMDEKRDTMDKYRTMVANQAKVEETNLNFANNPTVRSFRQVADAQKINLFSLMQGQLGSLINQVDVSGDDAEKKDILSTAKNNMLLVLDKEMQNVSAAYTAALQSPRLTDDARKAIEQEYNAYTSALKNQRKVLNEMDQEQFDKTSRMAKLLSDKNDTQLQKSFPQLMKLKQAMGPAFNSVMNAVLVRSPQLQQVTANTIEESVTSLLGTPAGQTILAESLDLEAMHNVMQGIGLQEYAEKSRDAAAAHHWNASKVLVESPEALDTMNDDQINNVGIGIIGILDRADELGDTDSMANANALLTSPALTKFVDRLPDNQKEVLTDYIAKSTAEFMRRQLSDDSFLKYNEQTGKIEGTLKRDPKVDEFNRRFTGGFLGGSSRPSRVQTAEKEANYKLNKAAEMVAKYHPTFKGDTEKARQYVLSRALPTLRTSLTEEEKQAASALESLEALRKRNELGERVQQFERTTAQVAGIDLSDLSPEEFEEYLAELRNQYNVRP